MIGNLLFLLGLKQRRHARIPCFINAHLNYTARGKLLFRGSARIIDISQGGVHCSSVQFAHEDPFFVPRKKDTFLLLFTIQTHDNNFAFETKANICNFTVQDGHLSDTSFQFLNLSGKEKRDLKQCIAFLKEKGPIYKAS